MKTLIKLSVRSLKKNKPRTFSTVLGIVLSTVLTTSVVLLVTCLLFSLKETTIQKNGNWHMAVLKANSNQLKKLIDKQGIKQYGGVENRGYAKIEGTNKFKPYINLTSVSADFFEIIPVNLMEGRFPENNSEILITKNFVQSTGLNIEIGDSIRFELGKRQSNSGEELSQLSSYLGLDEEIVEKTPANFKITGICDTINSLEFTFSPGYTLLTYDDSKDFLNRNLYINLANPSDVYKYANSIIAEENVYFNSDLLSVLGVSEGESIKGMLVTLATILILVIVGASVLLICNSFLISLSERIKSYGLLMSLGMTKGQMKLLVFCEAFILSIISIPIGVIIGIISIYFSFHTIAKIIADMMYAEMVFKLIINQKLIIIISCLSLINVMISALYPAFKASKMSAIDAIRQSNSSFIKRDKYKESKIITSSEAELVRNNYKRFKNKYHYTIISIVLSIVLMITSSSFCLYASDCLKEDISLCNYDIGCSVNGMPFDKVLSYFDIFSRIKGIKEGAWFAELNDEITVNIDKIGLTDSAMNYYGKDQLQNVNLNLVVIDDNRFNKWLSNNKVSFNAFYNPSELSLVTFADIHTLKKNEDGKDKVEKVNIFNNNQISLNFVNNNSNSNKKGILNLKMMSLLDMPIELKNYTDIDGIYGIIPYSMLKYYTNKEFDFVQMVFVASDHKGVFEEMSKSIDTNNQNISITDFAQGYDTQRNTIAAENIFTKIFSILIFIITLLNVFNTIATSIFIRKREFSILRSIGMGKRNFRKMMILECSLYCGISAIVGLAISTLLSYLIYLSLSTNYTIKFVLPLNIILITVISVFIALVITFAYSMKNVLKLNIIESIRDEIN